MIQAGRHVGLTDAVDEVSNRVSPKHEAATSETRSPLIRYGRMRCDSSISRALCYFAVGTSLFTCITAYTNPTSSMFRSSLSLQRSRYHHLKKKQPTMFGIRSSSSSTTIPLFASATEEESKNKIKRKTASKKKAKGRGKSDEEDWQSLIASFQMYKAAYGDLKVPSRFVVPSMPPWPGTSFAHSFQMFMNPLVSSK